MKQMKKQKNGTNGRLVRRISTAVCAAMLLSLGACGYQNSSAAPEQSPSAAETQAMAETKATPGIQTAPEIQPVPEMQTASETKTAEPATEEITTEAITTQEITTEEADPSRAVIGSWTSGGYKLRLDEDGFALLYIMDYQKSNVGSWEAAEGGVILSIMGGDDFYRYENDCLIDPNDNVLVRDEEQGE